jgi:hypothetical protein
LEDARRAAASGALPPESADAALMSAVQRWRIKSSSRALPALAPFVPMLLKKDIAARAPQMKELTGAEITDYVRPHRPYHLPDSMAEQARMHHSSANVSTNQPLRPHRDDVSWLQHGS